ncbi:hypothetical protein AM410_14770 [Enterobacter cloacae complex sp. FDA-CDC-AR_0164]|nr:hypothetical protein AM410_14770 [Enterobacter cloacae complex sp. FDA-CDC-AR_0164]
MDVKSKGFGEAAAGVLCILSVSASHKETRSVRRLSENKQVLRSISPRKIKMPFQLTGSG